MSDYEEDWITGSTKGPDAGTEYISLDDAVEAIASRDETDGTKPKFSGREVCDILESVPTLDLTEILERSEICGYTFRELVMFAEACQMQGITKDDLKDFCMNAEGAVQYVIDKIEEDLDHKFDKLEEDLDQLANLCLKDQEVEE